MRVKRLVVTIFLGIFLGASIWVTLANAKKVPYISNGRPYGG